VLVIEIDGAQGSGSGTIVRLSVALAMLTRQPLRLHNVRARRPKPGLRAQHLTAVQACAELCGARTEGLALGAPAFEFHPGPSVRGGRFAWDIGTAGSAAMLALGVLPAACLADRALELRIQGGVFQDFAPSPHHLQNVLLPILARMGLRAELRLVRAGYVPRGAGVIELRVEPARAGLEPLELLECGEPQQVRGIAFASHLAERRVAERMASACEARLARRHLPCRIERVEDGAALQPGAALAVWAETRAGCRIGADRAGAPRRSSERIGQEVARMLLEDLDTGASVDRHCADQLVPFALLARGTSRYVVPRPTEHLATNLWLAERFGARTRLDGRRVELTGLHRAAGLTS
jgi:RNA 3'-terminal phosphate cyclase (ATP)